MWLLICDGWDVRGPLQHFWDPWEAAVPLSNVKLLFYKGIILLLPASHVRGTYSISKDFTRNSTLPPKIPVFEQNQKRNEVLLLCFGFPVGHAEYLITASQRHDFLFGFVPELLWLILAQEQISGCSQWTLVLSRFGCSSYFVERPPGAQKRHFCTHVHTYVWAIYTYIPWGFTLMLL